MTYAQWLWEYEALKQKEKEEVETSLELMKLFRITIIKLLGLDLLAEKDEADEDDEDAGPVYVPLALMVSRREVVDVIMKKMEADSAIQKSLADDAFEAMSAAMARGELIGDMEPVISEPAAQEDTVRELLYREELAAVGVKIVENTANVPHIQLNNLDAVKRSKEMVRELEAARRSVVKELAEDKLNKPKTTIKFDEDGDDNA
jgi:hypothetical protein